VTPIAQRPPLDRATAAPTRRVSHEHDRQLRRRRARLSCRRSEKRASATVGRRESSARGGPLAPAPSGSGGLDSAAALRKPVRFGPSTQASPHEGASSFRVAAFQLHRRSCRAVAFVALSQRTETAAVRGQRSASSAALGRYFSANCRSWPPPASGSRIVMPRRL